MGGEVAMRLALEGAVKTRGFIVVALGGLLSREPERAIALIEANQARRLRGYFVLGEQDAGHYEGAKALVGLLRTRNIPCEFESHAELGHAFPPDFEQSLKRALAFVLSD